MKLQLRVQLSVMMFLNYVVWGAWYVTMGTYLNETLQFTGTQIGLAYGAAAIAAMISPFFVGMVADRFFPTEKVMGVLHLIGAGLMYWASTVEDFGQFYPILLAYAITYMPTIALTNSLSFSHIDNPDKQFPSIRVFGTIGWIVINLIIGAMMIEKEVLPLQISAGAAVVMGLFSFSLPNTPPKSKGQKVTVREVLGLDALALMKQRSFAVLVIASVLICIPLSFYYSFANAFLNELDISNAAGKMTMGQMSEVFFLAVMPFFFVRLGVKKMIIIGMAAWSIRYLLFAYGGNPLLPDSGLTADQLVDSISLVSMLYLGIILHGVCFDFFFVTGQIYVDREAPDHLKGSAQGLITFATYGLGMFIGTWLSGVVVDYYKTAEGAALPHDWQGAWMVPAVLSFIALVFFALMFKDSVKEEKSDAVEA